MSEVAYPLALCFVLGTFAGAALYFAGVERKARRRGGKIDVTRDVMTPEAKPDLRVFSGGKV